jgi:hypothetical protein
VNLSNTKESIWKKKQKKQHQLHLKT